jgi:formylmethanofuran:tetrahydromethanopterin formyltransferase
MTNNGVVIDDTFAEAFGMRATRLVITAASARGRVMRPSR